MRRLDNRPYVLTSILSYHHTSTGFDSGRFLLAYDVSDDGTVMFGM